MTGRSVVNRASNWWSSSPCGCAEGGCSASRSTTFTTRTRRSGTSSRSSITAASVSSVGTSPAQAITTSTSCRGVRGVAGPVPDARPGGAVAHRGVHVEPLPLGLLAGDDDVDEVAAAQAVVGHRQQAVGVGRQVDAHHVRLLVGDVVDEAGVLVRQAVVVLAPDVRGEQVVERGHRRTPRDVPAHAQPLGVLAEHRRDDGDEGLVAREQPVPPGEQVTLQPAFAQVLAQDFHHASVGAEVGVGRFGVGHPDLVGHFEHGVEPVRGGLVGAEEAEVRRRQVQGHHVAQPAAQHPRRLGPARARLRHGHGVCAQVGQRQRLQRSPPLACGLAPMRCEPVRASAARSSRSAPWASNSSCGR